MIAARIIEPLPSVLREHRFNDRELVEIEDGLLIPVYVASQLGFNEPDEQYQAKHGTVIGIESDFRLGENLATGVNAAVKRFLEYDTERGGRCCFGERPYDKGSMETKRLAERLRSAQMRKGEGG